MLDVKYIRTLQLAAGYIAVPGAGLTSCIKDAGISATLANNGYGWLRKSGKLRSEKHRDRKIRAPLAL